MKPNLFVAARFLDRLAEDTQWTKARLQLAVRLNYDVFVRYLDYLEGRGFLAVDDDASGSARVTITPDGSAARARLVALLGEWVEGSHL